MSPAGPAGPAEPVAPAAPVAPVGPAGPDGPGGPADPVAPTPPPAPFAPAGPGAPVGPTLPCAPMGPVWDQSVSVSLRRHCTIGFPDTVFGVGSRMTPELLLTQAYMTPGCTSADGYGDAEAGVTAAPTNRPATTAEVMARRVMRRPVVALDFMKMSLPGVRQHWDRPRWRGYFGWTSGSDMSQRHDALKGHRVHSSSSCGAA